MRRQKVIQDKVHNQCPIQSQYGGCIPEVLQGYERLLNDMIKTIPQVAVSHLEITWPDGYDYTHANEVVGCCLSALRKSLQYQKIVSCYGWVREVAEGRLDGKPHFHIGFFTNAHELQSGFTIAQRLNELFTKQFELPSTSIYVRCIYPNIDCQRGLNLNCPSAIKLRVNAPNAEEQRLNILNWLSYHAKVETKGNTPSVREFAFSKVK